MTDFNPFIIIGASLISAIVIAYILKSVFRIDDQIKNQREQIDLLREVSNKLK